MRWIKKVNTKKKKKKIRHNMKLNEKEKKYIQRIWERLLIRLIFWSVDLCSLRSHKSRHKSWRSLDFLACLTFPYSFSIERAKVYLIANNNNTKIQLNYFLWRQNLDRLKWIKVFDTIRCLHIVRYGFYISLCDYCYDYSLSLRFNSV